SALLFFCWAAVEHQRMLEKLLAAEVLDVRILQPAIAPCATIGRACSVANSSVDRVTNIQVAPGMYRPNTSCNVYYHRLVGVFGHCNDRPDIVLSTNDVAFWAQDSAILVVQCVNIWSVGKRVDCVCLTPVCDHGREQCPDPPACGRHGDGRAGDV